MRKGRDGGEKNGGGNGKKGKKLMRLVATTSLPAVDPQMLTAGTPHARANIFFNNTIYANQR